MSELGPLNYGDSSEPLFLGRDISQKSDYSQDTAILIDKEIKRIVDEAYERATAILTQYREVLDQVAMDLLEHEAIDGDATIESLHDLAHSLGIGRRGDGGHGRFFLLARAGNIMVS